MATAIANAEARAQVARLADEQAALRRVATLVAQGARPSAVFDAVTTRGRRAPGRLGGDAGPLRRRACHGGRPPRARLLRAGRRALPARRRRTSRRPCCARDGPRGSTTTRTRRGPIGESRAEPASGRRSRPPSSSTAAPGACSRRSGRTASRRPTTPRSGWPGSPSCSTPRSPTRTAATSSPRRAPACSPQATTRAGAWCGTCTTAPSSGSCTRSSRSSSRSGAPRGPERRGVAARRGARHRASGRQPRCASSRTASCPRSYHGGLRAGVDALASRTGSPRRRSTSWSERLPPDIEASAYFIVAEALTNVVKHARATRATVRAAVDDGVLTLEVRDDGVGGANPDGHGLIGIADRVDALGGRCGSKAPRAAGRCWPPGCRWRVGGTRVCRRKDGRL